MGPSTRRQYGLNAHSLTPELGRNLLWLAAQRHRAVTAEGYTAYTPSTDGRALSPNDVSISTHLPMWFAEMAFSADAESRFIFPN